MKKAIRRILKRIFILIMIVFAVYLLISNIDLIRDLASDEKIKVLIDSDASNGIDDLLSIVRILEYEDVELTALLSAQWRLADLENDSTVLSNRELHNLILKQYRKERLTQALGNPLPLRYSRAKEDPVNPASETIIRAVHELAYQQKLNILCLGSATNIASAIIAKPEITDKIICYIRGAYYEPARRAWDKSDPVSSLDLEAMNILLDNDKLELYLIPSDIAGGMLLSKSELMEKMDGRDTLFQLIRNRAMFFYPETDTIRAESLALVTAFLNPDMSTAKQLITPPENTQRKIYVYTRIDQNRMEKDWWKTVEDYGR